MSLQNQDRKNCYVKCDINRRNRCETVCDVNDWSRLLITYLLPCLLPLLFLLYKYRVGVFRFAWFLLVKLQSMIQCMQRVAMRSWYMRPLLLEGTALTKESVEAIYDAASKAYKHLKKVLDLVDENELESALSAIHETLYLRDCALESKEARQTSSVQGVLGSSTQLGGLCFIKHPVGWFTLVTGTLLKFASEVDVEDETKTTQNDENKPMEIFDRDSERFRILKKALAEFEHSMKLLNEALAVYTGRSLTDPCYRRFIFEEVFGIGLRQDILISDGQGIAAFAKQQFKTYDRTNRNPLEILRDSAVAPLVKYLAKFMECEHVALARTVVFNVTALTPNLGATYIKSGELAAGCVTLYKQYKDNKISISELNKEIEGAKSYFEDLIGMRDKLKECGLP